MDQEDYYCGIFKGVYDVLFIVLLRNTFEIFNYRKQAY